MKKVILIISCILFFTASYGQQSIVKVKNYTYGSYFKDKRCDEIVTLTAFTTDGKDHLLISYNKGTFNEGSSSDRSYVVPGIVERLELYLFGNDARDQGVSKSCRKGRRVETNPPLTENINMNPCASGSYYHRHNNSSDVWQEISLDYEVIPVPRVDRTTVSDLAGFEDPINVTASPGYNNSVYNWQYGTKVGEITTICGFPPRPCVRPIYDWNELSVPNAQNASIVLEDFLTEDIIGEEIYFRIQSCNQNASNIISYKVRKSAPHIVSIETKDVSCYDAVNPVTATGDGAITITFDRPLDETKDLFAFEVFDPDKGTTVTNDDNITNFSEGNGSVKHTITGLPGSTTFFTLRILGQYNGILYYTEADSHEEDFVINRPSPVAFDNDVQAEVTDVWCHGGDDGLIELKAKGGVEKGYHYLIKTKDQSWTDPTVIWRPFSSGFEHTITELNSTTKIFANTYHIKIRDGNGCIAKVQKSVGADGEILLGEDIVQEIEIKEPVDPLTVDIDLVNEPRAFGFEDGRIVATIKGGTAKSGGVYDYQWVDKNNNPVNTTIESLNADGDYTVVLHSIGTGEYKITVRDAHYDLATNKAGCIEVSDVYILDQPDPLEVRIEILNEVSCNRNNEYNDGADFNDPIGVFDQFQDGALIAYAKGGVAYDTTSPDFSEPFPTNSAGDLLPYYFSWKKLVGGTWVDLNINNDRIENLSEGTFALNIRDKNGIELGTYLPISTPNGQEYILDELIDVERYLPQPDILEVSFSKTVISCANGNDAIAVASVKGGTKPYTYRWSNGVRDTNRIENLFAGTYILYVEDAKGCQLEGSVTIEQPNGLEIDPVVVKSPTCFEGTDGEIQINVTGGNPPYKYEWNTGATSTFINSLSAGSYIIEITDDKNCKAFKEITLIDPDPIIVNMEEKRSLCSDQSLNLDITIDDPLATYSWTADNGFSSTQSTIEITQQGIYTATITSSLGCIGTGSIEVEVFDTPIDSDFLITTQAYTGEDVILVNVSEPMGERVEWTIPDGIDIVSKTDEELILRFPEEGAYDINLRSYQIDCYEDFTKTVIVQPAIETPDVNTTQGEFIEEFIVYPNPNEGSFKAKIALAESSNIKIKILDLMSGKTVHERQEKDNLDFLLDFSVSMPTGVYLLLLETPNGSSQTLKLVFE